MDQTARLLSALWPARILLVCLLLGLAVQSYRSHVVPTVGMDFYHLWGIFTAQELSGYRLGSPYTDPDRYASVLNAHADTSADRRLQAVNKQWRRLTPTGSPLLYASFFFMPLGYSSALIVYRVLQLAFLVLGFGQLARRLSVEALFAAEVSLVLFLGYEPIRSDLRVANTNTLHLFGFSVLLVIADALRRTPSGRSHWLLATLFLAGGAFLALIKPLWALLTCLLAVHLWVAHGTRRFRAAAVPAAIVAVGLALIPCAVFGSWFIWTDWCDYVSGGDRARLLFPIVHGNYSAALLLHETLQVPVWIVMAVLASGLSGSLLLVGRRRDEDSNGRIRASLAEAFREPQCAMALGIVATAATSPLFWVHYYVVLLIPAVWLLVQPSGEHRPAVLAGVAIVLCSGLLDPVWLAFSWGGTAIPWCRALSVACLWSGILLHVRSGGEGGAAVDGGNAVAPAGQRSAHLHCRKPATGR
jgi:hypothetical protein